METTTLDVTNVSRITLPAPTREEWLLAFTKRLQPWFLAHGEWGIPDNLRVSCGWPTRGATSPENRTLGQCFQDDCSEGKVFEIFVSPYVADSLEVGAIIVHEVVHAIVGAKEKHAGQFRRVAKQVGLEGKMTSTVAGGQLLQELADIVAVVGPYPHAVLNGTTVHKPQTTRMLKIECEACGYTARVTKKWALKGLPICCCQLPKLQEAGLDLNKLGEKVTLSLDGPITDEEEGEE